MTRSSRHRLAGALVAFGLVVASALGAARPAAAERLIVHAVLVDTTDKSDGGPPPALEGR